ncbi:SCO family protein [bacterium]|nr:MAG: SCO family protein [bacterium]
MKPFRIHAFFLGAVLFGASLAAASAAPLQPLIPMHGIVLAQTSANQAIVRNDAVAQMLPAQTRAYRIPQGAHLHPGEQFDAYLKTTTSPWTLEDLDPGTRYAVGQAFPSVTRFLEVGDKLPDVPLVDQHDQPVQFSDFRGKTTLLTVIYARCTDICPVITRKFVSIASTLSPKRFHFVEVTIDPNNDTPSVLQAYAHKYGAVGPQWTFLAGEPRVVGKLLAQLGISSVHGSDHVTVAGDRQVGASDALIDHSEPLVIIDKNGRIASIIQNAAVSPSMIIAQARHDDGLVSNGFKRFELAATSLVYSVCGGFLVGETTVMVGFWILVIGLPITTFALWQIWRRVFSDRSHA